MLILKKIISIPQYCASFLFFFSSGILTLVTYIAQVNIYVTKSPFLKEIVYLSICPSLPRPLQLAHTI
jgi:hypothetical protein